MSASDGKRFRGGLRSAFKNLDRIMTNTKPPNTQSSPPPNAAELPKGISGISTARPVVRIEINFPVGVELPDGFERELDALVDKACKHYERAHPDRVMWPAGHGSKVLWCEPDEPDFDPSVYEISVAERERYESER
jgi:hypothetical protein